MSRFFKFCTVLVLLLKVSWIYGAKSEYKDTQVSNINPVFKDSVLKHKLDTVQFHQLQAETNKFKKASKVALIEQLKQPSNSVVYFVALFILLFLLLLVRLFFEDFFISLLESLKSNKQFFIFYKSKKFDSFLALLSVYALHLVFLSYIMYCMVHYIQTASFKQFDWVLYLELTGMLAIFFTVKFIVEYVFNWITDTEVIFKTFFIQTLFIELFLYVGLILLGTFFIYYPNFTPQIFLPVVAVFLMLALVFNILRSFQLLQDVKIAYKLHFFLYLCAFKLLPLLLLGKYVLNYLAV